MPMYFAFVRIRPTCNPLRQKFVLSRCPRYNSSMSHCEHCQFFKLVMVPGPSPGDRLIGHCQRFPPTAGRPTPLKAEAANPDLSHFPLVKGSDWCGEFTQTTTPMRRLSAPTPTTAPSPDLRLVVSSGEAAKMLDVSEKHLYTLSMKGDLPRVLIGARVCYRVETLRAWVAAHEGSGPRPPESKSIR